MKTVSSPFPHAHLTTHMHAHICTHTHTHTHTHTDLPISDSLFLHENPLLLHLCLLLVLVYFGGKQFNAILQLLQCQLQAGLLLLKLDHLYRDVPVLAPREHVEQSMPAAAD